jgi:carboxyl-terminal processing protease
LKIVKSILFYGVVFAFIAICLGNQVSRTPNAKTAGNELFEKLDLFASVLSLIQHSYVEEVQSRDLIYGALEGTLSSLDPHSQFLRPKLFREVQIDTEGEFGGLGIEVVIRDKFLVVVSPIPGTPAEHAGLKSGDRILKINGDLLDAPVLDEAVKKLRGPVGSKVEITVFRPSTKQYFAVEMVREKIHLQSVIHSQILPDTGIAYIKITRFQEGTTREFQDAFKDLSARNPTGLILDLRNNPGGLLEESIKLGGVLAGGEKLIVYTKGRLPEQNLKKFSPAGVEPVNIPLVLLINDGSASASEIVAGAVQDWEKGTVVGETSFGKASVQSLIPLKDGSAVRLTTAWYYTPKGRQIHEKGIRPDVEVPLSNEDYISMIERVRDIKAGKIDSSTIFQDSQIQKALELLGIPAKQPEAETPPPAETPAPSN